MVYSISLYTVASLLIFTVTEADKVPSPCGMGMSGCQTIIGTWAVGANGECSHKDTGFRIGQNGFKHVMMQVGVRANRPLLFFYVTRCIYTCTEKSKCRVKIVTPCVILTNLHDANASHPIFNLTQYFLFGYTTVKTMSLLT